MTNADFIKKAIEVSKKSVELDGFPVGSVVVKDGKVISEGISSADRVNDPTCHSEIDAIRKACGDLGVNNLGGAVLYSSLEPCLMCLSASFWAGVSKIVYACGKDKVSKEYYEGDSSLENINKSFYKSLELIHLVKEETNALEVIKNWE